MTMMNACTLDRHVLILRAEDDVGVARQPIPAQCDLTGSSQELISIDPIPAGHKIALRDIPDQAPVRKYGQIIGFAQGAIPRGTHVHSHNLVVRDFPRDCQIGSAPVTGQPVPSATIARQFQGYLRPDGRVGTRNYLAVISSVNCSASVARYVKEQFNPEQLRRDYPNIDGIIAFTHKGGCGVQPGEPHQLLLRVLVGMAQHPNIAGYVMIGLGCEVNQLDVIRKQLRLASAVADVDGPLFLNIQDAGGVRKTVDRATAAMTRLLPVANALQRTGQSLRHLTLALECGGSDAYSGITANPALGVASDELVGHGGTTVLAETPEIYGAEHLLLRRAVSAEVGQKLIDHIRWWEDHVRQHHASIDNNPAPGNKAGGLTTIYEKSLGAIAKGGQAPLQDVYRYAERIVGPGFCFMDTPGYDPVSMTGMVSGGCNMAVFTTGRGSVYGCKPAPCIKVATHTPLFNWLQDDIDFNAGTILDNTESVEKTGHRLFELIIAVASGQKTHSELHGMGDEEFAPWQLGPTF
jgi:altronate hydrolase